jgi:endonuclease III
MDATRLYFKIKKQREKIEAPVDTMGCSIAPAGIPEEERRLHILVSLFLSSQTRDEVTYAAMERLRRMLPEGREGKSEEYNGLTIENLVSSSTGFINGCIEKVGFHNRKAESLKKMAVILKERGMPETLGDVLSLPGIGNKMGFLYLNHACGRVLGIGVDTHVHRVSNRIGLVKTKDPNKTQTELERILPRDEWSDINRVLVGFGQKICLPVKPKCKECCVKDECPSSCLF